MLLEDSKVLLSFVLGGRNDSYLGDFKWRLSTSLNYLARNLAAIGRLKDAEIVLCDWNSDVPLADVLDLDPASRRIARFVRVPPEIARPVQKDSSFPYAIVQNVGIRRSRGSFIAQTDSDILYSPQALENLLGILAERARIEVPIHRALFVASRRQLPFAVSLKCPPPEEIDRYLALYGNMLKLDRLSLGLLAPSALTLMHRTLWEACGGYDERLIHWEWMDIDLYLRVTQRYAWFDLSNFGVSLYHLEHYPSEDRLRQRKTNPWTVPQEFRNKNTADWGLWDQPLSIQTLSPTQSPISSAPDGDLISRARNKFPEAVLRELGSPKTLDHVREAAQKAPSDSAEFAALCALAWYSLSRRPGKYLEFGIRYASAATVVALAYPAVEIYGIDSWVPALGKPCPSIYYCSETLTRSEHRGYLRFITGDPQSAMKRLRESFIGKPAFDLILFRGELFGDQAFQQAVDVVAHLAPGGMMVFSWQSSAHFTEFWRLFQCCLSEDEVLQLNSNTGIALKRNSP